MNELIEPTGSTEVADYNPAQNAMEIHASEAAVRAAKRAKDCDAIIEGISVMLDGEAEFAREYKGKYSAGGDKKSDHYDRTGVMISAEEYCNQFGFTVRGVQRWSKALLDAQNQPDNNLIEKEKQKQIAKTLKSIGMESAAHVSNNSGENEWYTPKEFIASAVAVMGSIDLDPASSMIANKTVGAARIYTKEENGLDKKWSGNIWLNPPYAQPLISDFSAKICAVADNQDNYQMIVLVNNATETTWFQDIALRADAICFVNKRIKFLDPDGNPGAPLQGQAILYFGEGDFINEFSKYGVVLNHV